MVFIGMNARRDQLTMNAFTMQGLNAAGGETGLRTGAAAGSRHQPQRTKTPHRSHGWFHSALYFRELWEEVVRTGGFEPPTSGATILRSNQLSYDRAPSSFRQGSHT
jgi:hypothetical protein